MSKFHKQLGKKFPGNRDLGESFINEIDSIRKAINALDRLTKTNFSIDGGKKIRIALAKAFAEIVAEIEVPILAKFSELGEKSKNDSEE